MKVEMLCFQWFVCVVVPIIGSFIRTSSRKKKVRATSEESVFLVFFVAHKQSAHGTTNFPSFSHFLLWNYGFQTNHLFSRSMCAKKPETTWVDVKAVKNHDGDSRWKWHYERHLAGFLVKQKMSLNFMGELKIDQPGSMSWASSHNHERNKGKCFLEDVYIYLHIYTYIYIYTCIMKCITYHIYLYVHLCKNTTQNNQGPFLSAPPIIISLWHKQRLKATQTNTLDSRKVDLEMKTKKSRYVQVPGRIQIYQ